MRIDMAEEYTLKVGEARPSDVGRGIARVDQRVGALGDFPAKAAVDPTILRHVPAV